MGVRLLVSISWFHMSANWWADHSEERLDSLRLRMAALGLDTEGDKYVWYLDLRKFGTAPMMALDWA